MIAIPQLVVADHSEAGNVLRSDDPTDFWDGFEHPLLDDDRLITLWAIAESDSPDDGLYKRLTEFEGTTDQDERRWVHVMSPRMLGALAAIGGLARDAVGRLAHAWACTDELEWIDEA